MLRRNMKQFQGRSFNKNIFQQCINQRSQQNKGERLKDSTDLKADKKGTDLNVALLKQQLHNLL